MLLGDQQLVVNGLTWVGGKGFPHCKNGSKRREEKRDLREIVRTWGLNINHVKTGDLEQEKGIKWGRTEDTKRGNLRAKGGLGEGGPHRGDILRGVRAGEGLLCDVVRRAEKQKG